MLKLSHGFWVSEMTIYCFGTGLIVSADSKLITSLEFNIHQSTYMYTKWQSTYMYTKWQSTSFMLLWDDVLNVFFFKLAVEIGIGNSLAYYFFLLYCTPLLNGGIVVYKVNKDSLEWLKSHCLELVWTLVIANFVPCVIVGRIVFFIETLVVASGSQTLNMCLLACVTTSATYHLFYS